MEILAVALMIMANLILITLLVTGTLEEISELYNLIATTVSTVVIYIVGRFMAFRHNIGMIELKAIEILRKQKNQHNVLPETKEYLASLESEIGPNAARMTYEHLIERGILKSRFEVRKMGDLPKRVQIVDSTWKVHLI